MGRLVAFGVVLATCCAVASGQSPPADEQVAWLKAHAVPFDTVDAGNGFDDLRPLAEMIGDARIVSLGESTHGSREIFRMKHRVLEFLASEMGFTIFSIEASMPESYRIDDYVLGGAADPRALIGGMYFWTWNTEEVLDLVEWMRAFNAGGRGPVHFTGFDMQFPDVALAHVGTFLLETDPELHAEVRDDLAAIGLARRQGGAAAAFGVATGSFPVDRAAGRHVRFSGYIRTEIDEGWAGLWWRVDGEDGVLAFDNMLGRGPTGTTDWTAYDIELDVPEDATNINFGCIFPGSGTVWFDGLRVELDGEAFEPGTAMDLDFEGDRIAGFWMPSPGYRAAIDPARAKVGRRSLRMETTAKGPGEVEDGSIDPAEAAKLVEGLIERMEERREGWPDTVDPRQIDWAIQNATVVLQCMRSRAGVPFHTRDRSMAENVHWILEESPDAKIVLWAHNGHVADDQGAMGSYLEAWYGDEHVPVGFATGRGAYQAIGDGGLGVHELQPPPPGSIESFLAATGEPRLIVDLRPAEPGSAESGWLHEPRPFRSVGALAMNDQFTRKRTASSFEILIWIEETGAARPLK